MGGQLQIVHLAETGDNVKAGDVVVEFDTAEQEFNLEQARFDLQLAQQEIVKADAQARSRSPRTRSHCSTPGMTSGAPISTC